MHPIIKPWPFRGWGLDFIRQINPPSSKGHRFVLVATDYFTKWSEAVPLKNMTHREVIEFITEHIIHRLAKQNDLSVVDYHDLMMDNIDKVTEKRLRALKEIKK